MAILIKPDYSKQEVSPNGCVFTLNEIYNLLNCGMIQIVPLENDRLLVCDEEGKLKPHRMNPFATMLLRRAGGMPDDYIAGDALIVDTTEIE